MAKLTRTIKYTGCDHAAAIGKLEDKAPLLRAAVGKSTEFVCEACKTVCKVEVLKESHE